MNETFKRRLIGLILLLAVLFGLSWLLPRDGKGGSGDVPTTLVPLPATEVAGVPATPTTEGGESPSNPPDNGTESRAENGDATAPPPVAVEPSAPAPPQPPAQSSIAKSSVPSKPKPVQSPPPNHAAVTSTIAQAAPAPTKPAATPTPQADGRIWYVQIGSFADRGNAQTTLSLLQNIGYQGETAAVAGANGATLYRVRLGPFSSEAPARQTQAKVAHQGYPQSRALSEARTPP